MPRAHRTSRGFTLLEVILALAILAGSIAVLGQVMQNGNKSGEAAYSLTQAQLLAASKMSELTSGFEPLAAVAGAPLDVEEEGWLYSIELLPTIEPNLVAVRVTVKRDTADESPANQFTLTRWMVDPGVAAAAESSTAEPSSANSFLDASGAEAR